MHTQTKICVQTCKCLCPSAGQTSLSPPFVWIQEKWLILLLKKEKKKLMNEAELNTSPCSICAIPCCRKGAIFIRASYGTSHGQNNISVAVTSVWRQDESMIKIKGNEYKWCLLHLEGEINHRWANVGYSLTFPLCCVFVISHRYSFILCLSSSFFFCLSFSDSLSLIKLPAKCPLY